MRERAKENGKKAIMDVSIKTTSRWPSAAKRERWHQVFFSFSAKKKAFRLLTLRTRVPLSRPRGERSETRTPVADKKRLFQGEERAQTRFENLVVFLLSFFSTMARMVFFFSKEQQPKEKNPRPSSTFDLDSPFLFSSLVSSFHSRPRLRLLTISPNCYQTEKK